MTAFADTSALYSLLDSDEKNHRLAGEKWVAMMRQGEHLVTTNYVVVETCSLLHRRLGVPAVRKFLADVLPAIMVEWIDASAHTVGINGVLASSKSGPSLVDCVSFAVMHELGVRTAFTFDKHFRDQGFDCIP